MSCDLHPERASSAHSASVQDAEDLHAPERPHLLVVEDEPAIRQLLVSLLIAAGYSVSEAVDGFAALEEVRRRPPALILSDLNMPRMSGFELLSVIRRRFPVIPVIAMSGAFAGDAIPHGVSADAFYEKSGRHINTLVAVIDRLLAASAALARPDVVTTPEPPGFPPVALWVTRRGNPIPGPYVLLTCQECLRSFPHAAVEDGTMEVLYAGCIFCGTLISYALLDSSVSHHPGYAPAQPSPSHP